MSVSISSRLPQSEPRQAPPSPPPAGNDAVARVSGSLPPACDRPETQDQVSICGMLERDQAKAAAERRKIDDRFFEDLEKNWPFH